MADNTKHLVEEIKRLLDDERDCSRRGLTDQAIMVQRNRRRLQIALDEPAAKLEVIKQRST